MYQLRSPRSSIQAGMSTVRTRVASTRMATPRPNPICWNITSWPAAKPANTATMMSAAPVIRRAVDVMPYATASRASPRWS